MLSKRRFMKNWGHILAKALLLEAGFRAWLQHLLLQTAVSSAYHTFAQEHPFWAASLFDEYFLRGQAAPLLARYLQTESLPTPNELAKAWFDQFGPLWPRAATRSDTEVTKVASDFLQVLNAELCRAGR